MQRERPPAVPGVWPQVLLAQALVLPVLQVPQEPQGQASEREPVQQVLARQEPLAPLALQLVRGLPPRACP